MYHSIILTQLLLLALTSLTHALPSGFPAAATADDSFTRTIDRVGINFTTNNNRTVVASPPVREVMTPGVYHLATAGPVPRPGLQQGSVAIEVCTDMEWQGICQHLDSMRGTCYNLFPPFNNSISSVAPDADTYCTLYTEPSCKFDDRAPLRDIISPGIYDLREYEGFWDSVSSYQCV